MTVSQESVVSIPVGGVELDGILAVPEGATGLVVFAHGSGSSRLSPRNNYVADVIRDRGVATLLFDLLTTAEDRSREARFDIDLLTERLVGVTDWLRTNEATSHLQFGYFGSSTGAASALRAAARFDAETGAVVSRGGRVDLATDVLEQVTAPTLFVVGGEDVQVLELNREALERLPGEKSLHVVDGAGHLFEEAAQLSEVAAVAAAWFDTHLA